LFGIDHAIEERNEQLELLTKELAMLELARIRVKAGEYDEFFKPKTVLGTVNGIPFGLTAEGKLVELAPVGDIVTVFAELED